MKYRRFKLLVMLGLAVVNLMSTLYLSKTITHAQTQPIEVQVNWNQVTGRATQSSYGVNVFQGFRPDFTANTSYQAGVQFLHPGILRYHNEQMLNDSSLRTEGWVIAPTTANYAWDRAKIARAIVHAYPGVNASRIITIPGFPAYMRDSHGRLKPEFYNAYAAFCADLVRVINLELRQGFVYWEVTNELDDGEYASEQLGNGMGMDEVGKIYQLAAAAMRQVDPTIKVGGAAFSNPYNTTKVSAFVNQAYSSLDFVSFHTYSTFTTFDPLKEPNNQGVWQSAENRGAASQPIRNVLAQAQQRFGPRSIEIFHNEYNISGIFSLNDPRMKDDRGMIYDALAMASIANSGITGSMAWNEADSIYGKLASGSNNTWVRRPAANVFNLYNQFFRGEIVTSSHPTRTLDAGKVLRGEIAANQITTYAVKNSSRKALALINRSESSQTARVFWGSNATVQAYTVSKNGIQTGQLQLSANGNLQSISQSTILILVQP